LSRSPSSIADSPAQSEEISEETREGQVQQHSTSRTSIEVMKRSREIYLFEVIKHDYIQYLLSVEVLIQVNSASDSKIETLLLWGVQQLEQLEFLFITINQAP
jgi:hypothetical protein